jgi:hypothetical protein
MLLGSLHRLSKEELSLGVIGGCSCEVAGAGLYLAPVFNARCEFVQDSFNAALGWAGRGSCGGCGCQGRAAAGGGAQRAAALLGPHGARRARRHPRRGRGHRQLQASPAAWLRCWVWRVRDWPLLEVLAPLSGVRQAQRACMRPGKRASSPGRLARQAGEQLRLPSCGCRAVRAVRAVPVAGLRLAAVVCSS